MHLNVLLDDLYKTGTILAFFVLADACNVAKLI